MTSGIHRADDGLGMARLDAMRDFQDRLKISIGEAETLDVGVEAVLALVQGRNVFGGADGIQNALFRNLVRHVTLHHEERFVRIFRHREAKRDISPVIEGQVARPDAKARQPIQGAQRSKDRKGATIDDAVCAQGFEVFQRSHEVEGADRLREQGALSGRGLRGRRVPPAR